MGRGLGDLQRCILRLAVGGRRGEADKAVCVRARRRGCPLDVCYDRVFAEFYDCSPGPEGWYRVGEPVRVAVYRALKSLERRGLVVLGPHFKHGATAGATLTDAGIAAAEALGDEQPEPKGEDSVGGTDGQVHEDGVNDDAHEHGHCAC